MWSFQNLQLLYTSVVKKFGPHVSWGKSKHPKGREKEFNKFCENFATVVGANSGEAVQHQIAYAVAKTETVLNYKVIPNTWRNKIVAFECGFINQADYFPRQILMQYRPSIGTQSEVSA